MRKEYGPDKERDPFQHFLNDLLEMSYESDKVRELAEVFKTCRDSSCGICVALRKMFSSQPSSVVM